MLYCAARFSVKADTDYVKNVFAEFSTLSLAVLLLKPGKLQLLELKNLAITLLSFTLFIQEKISAQLVQV